MGRRSLLKVIDPFLLVLGAICLLGIGVLIGVLIESDGSSSPPTLEADEIGNVKDGRALFVTQGCAMCHSFEGQGGSDAPSLDYMRGEMTGGEIANMSGQIWNHVPMMKEAFAEEHIPFPEFTGNQMASLIAYLHAGGPPPDMEMMDGQAMGRAGAAGQRARRQEIVRQRPGDGRQPDDAVRHSQSTGRCRRRGPGSLHKRGLSASGLATFSRAALNSVSRSRGDPR